MSTHKHENRLAKEKSPYLLQHKNNPVDWFPWGEEAFKASREANKPILLSVGYSTCHWCHVMEKESFESEKIAELMNKYFVNIKVDREERPTVDRMYMRKSFVQALTGHGGWPMTVFLTPSLQPFFGGTYFAPEDKYGNPGFPKVLKYFGELWQNDAEELTKSSNKIMDDLRRMAQSGSSPPSVGPEKLTLSIPHKAYKRLEVTYDDELGGFGSQPKFPTPVIFHFLLSYFGLMNVPEAVMKRIPVASIGELQHLASSYGVELPSEDMSDRVDEMRSIVEKGLENRRAEANKSFKMVDFTLRQIARGGIHDHVGSGFHRYSVDKYWHVPHFEKMLYDQAQLLSSYTDIYLIHKEPFFEEVSRDIIKYVTRDLCDPQGGFYSAEDADSFPADGDREAKEGAFCVWEAKEIQDTLGPDAPLYSSHFGVLPGGNVMASSDPHGELTNKNVLIERETVEETSQKYSKTVDEVKAILMKCNEKLWEVRLKRPKPHRDDKIIVCWNGLMISALAKASRAFADPTILNTATRAATFVQSNLYDPTTRTLRRTMRSGVPSDVPACADDYAFLISGLIDLYEAGLELKWIRWAADLQATMVETFWDSVGGGFFTGRGDDDSVLLRLKDDYDGAEPTANSVSVSNLLRLDGILPSFGIAPGSFGQASEFRQKAEGVMLSNIETLARQPRALPYMVAGCLGYVRGFKEFVVHGDLSHPSTQSILRVLNSHFHPASTLLHVPATVTPSPEFEWLCGLNPVIESIATKPLDEGVGCEVFVCEGGMCGMPLTDVSEVERVLAQEEA
ncbi:spermatogenesis-associated protein 20 [Dinochytrium kinnereticum]|nr:spermatogenesis-associated protein 20 [Dinochytrium kinnereticum]